MVGMLIRDIRRRPNIVAHIVSFLKMFPTRYAGQFNGPQGDSQLADGNNQESSSNHSTPWVMRDCCGAATGDTELQESRQRPGSTPNATAVEEYGFFDVSGTNYPNDFPERHWGCLGWAKVRSRPCFHRHRLAIPRHNWLPFTPAS